VPGTVPEYLRVSVVSAQSTEQTISNGLGSVPGSFCEYRGVGPRAGIADSERAMRCAITWSVQMTWQPQVVRRRVRVSSQDLARHPHPGLSRARRPFREGASGRTAIHLPRLPEGPQANEISPRCAEERLDALSVCLNQKIVNGAPASCDLARQNFTTPDATRPSKITTRGAVRRAPSRIRRIDSAGSDAQPRSGFNSGRAARCIRRTRTCRVVRIAEVDRMPARAEGHVPRPLPASTAAITAQTRVHAGNLADRDP